MQPSRLFTLTLGSMALAWPFAPESGSPVPASPVPAPPR